MINNLADIFLYYAPQYLKIQNYDQIETFSASAYECHFSICNTVATSLTQSPFGGILSEKSDLPPLISFWKNVQRKLSLTNISQIEIIQPPDYYGGFVSTQALKELGFFENGYEWNQYVDLRSAIAIHPMQKRHLNKKKDFNIRLADPCETSDVHAFISKCRQAQGLKINISLEKLASLIAALPNHFDMHVVELNKKLVSAAIMVKATPSICYYYLPATDPKFKKMSPMVHLLVHLYDYYQKQGFAYMDLGLSSINKMPQSGLFEFKARMGAKAVKRSEFILKI